MSPVGRVTRLTAKSMPQLDFREALSTPEEKLFSPPATVTASSAPPLDKKTSVFAHGVRFSRSTWTNILFVTIASVGGLACAFYFFNGGELLRAAAAWPNEFLYPRPLPTELSTDKIDIGQQPNPVDQFARNEAGSTTTEEAKAPFGENVGPTDFSQPATTIGASNPTVTTPVGSGATLLPTAPSLPATPSLPTAPSLPNGLGLPSAPSPDSLFQSLYQTATSTTPTAARRTVSSKVSSTRKKVSSARAKLADQAKSGTTTTSSPRSATQSTQQMQQTVNQTQVGMSAIQAPSQMMMGGGLGAGPGGALGGVGGSLGGTLGGLGGTLGGLPGHH
jgi:hypothetical protein